MQRRNYLNKLSGPLMDRIDIRIDLPALPPSILTAAVGQGESSAVVGEGGAAGRGRDSLISDASTLFVSSVVMDRVNGEGRVGTLNQIKVLLRDGTQNALNRHSSTYLPFTSG